MKCAHFVFQLIKCIFEVNFIFRIFTLFTKQRVVHKYANKDALDLFTLTLFQMFIFG